MLNRAFFINSALAFSSAELLTAMLHEAGHGLAAQALGFSPKIYAFFENNPTGTSGQNLTILAAGPLTSLLLGVLLLFWYRRQRARCRFGRLLLFWMAWLGIMTFVNYLVVTPWLAAGDTAQIADILGWAMWVRYLVAAVGIALIIWIAQPAGEMMFAVAPHDVPLETGAQRRRFIVHGFYLPLIAGVMLTALAGVGGQPINIALGLFGALGNIDIVAAALYRVGNARVALREPGDLPRIDPAAVALYLILVVFYATALPRGVPV